MHCLIGHAIVSAEDRVADASGHMPETLHNEADWALFQAALDRAALTLIGRASHEATPNLKNRRRLIVSGSARGLEQRSDGLWLNPVEIALGEALESALPDGGDVAVVGGQGVFELVGAAGFAEFHLARACRVSLPGGRGLFRACERGVRAEEILAGGGLVAGPAAVIDAEAYVTLTEWRR